MYALGDSARVGIVLGYGAIDTDAIPEGLRLPRTCFDRRVPAARSASSRSHRRFISRA
jgi:hypothetical protein